MQSIIAGRLVVLVATLIAACADPVGPIPQSVDDRTVVAVLARQRPTAPDSVGIPPSIPPIFEPLPPELEAPR